MVRLFKRIEAKELIMARETINKLLPIQVETRPEFQNDGMKQWRERIARYQEQLNGLNARIDSGVIIIKKGHKTNFSPSGEEVVLPLTGRQRLRRQRHAKDISWRLNDEFRRIDKYVRVTISRS